MGEARSIGDILVVGWSSANADRPPAGWLHDLTESGAVPDLIARIDAALMAPETDREVAHVEQTLDVACGAPDAMMFEVRRLVGKIRRTERERDAALAEIDRLRAEVDELKQAKAEALRLLGECLAESR